MSESNKNQIVCRNGHPQRNTISKFCIYCGTPLEIFAAIPQSQKPVQQQAVPQQPAQQPPVQQPPIQQNVQQPIQQQPVQPPIQQQPVIPVPLPQMPVQQQQPVQPQQQQFQNNQAQVYQNLPMPPQQYNYAPPNLCRTCGGEGRLLEEKIPVCKDCKWLRPLSPGYGIAPEAFQWAEDGKAMAVLRSMTPLKMAAETVSEKVGRRWIETTFNGVLLGPKQLPEVYFQAVKAAQILGMSYMPDVYVSGDLMWDCRTYGSDKNAFIIMGSILATNFRGPELLFLFAREMGHCRSGHALWKTVIQFLVGDQGQRRGMMRGGLFAEIGKFLSPTALIEGTMEIPLMAWARQSEITADRAGLLAVGNEEIVRKILLTWSLKSPLLYRQINVAAWLEQQSAEDDDMTKLSELMTSSTPYITRRLKLISQFAQSPEMQRWQSIIKQYVDKAKAQTQPNDKKQLSNNDVIRMKCSSCGTPMRIPSKILEGKEQMAIRCPDPKCGKATYLKKKISPAPKGNEVSKKVQREIERNMTYDE